MRQIKTRLKAWCLIPVTVLIAMIMGTTGTTDAHADVDIETVKSSVVWVDTSYEVQVAVPFQNGTVSNYPTTLIGYCTGFIISESGYVATAAHCVQTGEDERNAAKKNVIADLIKEGYELDTDPTEYDWQVTFEDPTIMIGQPNTPEQQDAFDDGAIVARLVDSQSFETGDNALLQLANVPDLVSLGVSNTKPDVGDDITSFGFPGNTAAGGDVGRLPPTVKEYTVSNHYTTNRGVAMLELDGQIQQGMSGGPAVDENGQVVGVNSGLHLGSTVSYITDTDIFREFLENNGVDVAIADAPQDGEDDEDGGPISQPDQANQPATVSQDSDTSPVMMIAVVGLGLAVLGMIVWFVALPQYKKRTSAKKEDEPVDSAPPSSPI